MFMELFYWFGILNSIYLLGGSNLNIEIVSTLQWEAIKFASSFVDEFDFEGTMIESIERFIRGLGLNNTFIIN